LVEGKVLAQGRGVKIVGILPYKFQFGESLQQKGRFGQRTLEGEGSWRIKRGLRGHIIGG